jgi:hypothetical protein
LDALVGNVHKSIWEEMDEWGLGMGGGILILAIITSSVSNCLVHVQMYVHVHPQYPNAPPIPFTFTLENEELFFVYNQKLCSRPNFP